MIEDASVDSSTSLSVNEQAKNCHRRSHSNKTKEPRSSTDKSNYNTASFQNIEGSHGQKG